MELALKPKKAKSLVTADQILALLRERHNEDVFVPECKDGSTHNRVSHCKLDAWVMKKSWSNPLAIGYETKISRNDFLRDQKWQQYLNLCNEFYFVCPPGLISLDELPPSVGLLHATCNRLTTQRKAAWRDVQIPEALFRYILMCRVSVGPERDPLSRCNLNQEYWRKWLNEKEADRELGYRVAKGIQETVRAVRRTNDSLKSENDSFAEIKRILEAMGVKHVSEWEVKRRLNEVSKPEILPDNFLHRINVAIRDLQQIDILARSLSRGLETVKTADHWEI
jgi:hypothetical protein